MSEERVSEKFTPGAWETWASHHEMADTGEYYDEIGVMANGKQIAVMCGDLDDDEMEANANIMAAFKTSAGSAGTCRDWRKASMAIRLTARAANAR